MVKVVEPCQRQHMLYRRGILLTVCLVEKLVPRVYVNRCVDTAKPGSNCSSIYGLSYLPIPDVPGKHGRYPCDCSEVAAVFFWSI